MNWIVSPIDFMPLGKKNKKKDKKKKKKKKGKKGHCFIRRECMCNGDFIG